MADLADVMDALAMTAEVAVAVPAQGQPPIYLATPATITSKPIEVGQGWPLAEDIDKFVVQGGNAMVSIYHVPGAGGRPPQVFDFSPGVVTEAVTGLTLTAGDTSVTLSGTSLARETVAIVVDNKGYYSHVSTVPETAAVVAAALVAQISGASLSGSTISIPSAHTITAKNAGVAVLGQKIHRQSTQFRIVVWAPNAADRTTVARAIDVAVKREPKFDMPDTSQAIITFEGANLSDKEENAGLYRRDIMVTALYDTIDEYEAKEILGVQVTTTVQQP